MLKFYLVFYSTFFFIFCKNLKINKLKINKNFSKMQSVHCFENLSDTVRALAINPSFQLFAGCANVEVC